MTIFLFVVYILLFLHLGSSSETTEDIRNLVGKLSPEDRLSSVPCLREENHDQKKPYFPAAPLSNIEAQERRDRINESMARFMQLMTFFGHVDHFLTQKTSGFLKMMGKAVEMDDEEEDYIPRYRTVRRTSPKITTTISS